MVGIAPLDGNLAEGAAGAATAFTFQVTRAGDTSTAAAADWAVVAGGASADDFVGGALPEGTVSFAPGETEQTITIEVAGDDLVETSEGFLFTEKDGTAYLFDTPQCYALAKKREFPVRYIEDRNGNRLTYEYESYVSGKDTLDRVTRITDAVGRRLELEYSKIGQALAEAMKVESADYRVDARAYISTMLGEISYPVSIALQ